MLLSLLCFIFCVYYNWISRVKAGVSLASLTQPNFCVCPRPRQRFPSFSFSGHFSGRELFVIANVIGYIVDQHILTFQSKFYNSGISQPLKKHTSSCTLLCSLIWVSSRVIRSSRRFLSLSLLSCCFLSLSCRTVN